VENNRYFERGKYTPAKKLPWQCVSNLIFYDLIGYLDVADEAAWKISDTKLRLEPSSEHAVNSGSLEFHFASGWSLKSAVISIQLGIRSFQVPLLDHCCIIILYSVVDLLSHINCL
jgi:hypothetical protein